MTKTNLFKASGKAELVDTPPAKEPVDGAASETPADDSGSSGNGDEKKKKKPPAITYVTQMAHYLRALTIAKEEAEFNQFIASYGYDEARIDAGLTLHTNTLAADRLKMQKQAERHDATRHAYTIRAKAESTLNDCVDSGRIAFKDDLKTMELLRLIKPIPRRFDIWLEFAGNFYEVMLKDADLQAQIALYNISLEKLQLGSQEVGEVVTARKTQQSVKAAAQDATATKLRLYKELRAWMLDFYRIVGIAFRGRPQLKEKVGVIVPYGK